MAGRSYTKADVLEMAERCKNWGRFGPEDECGTLNFVTPEDVANAARLVRRGRVFAMGIPMDRDGPQSGLFGGRWNPIRTMLTTGTDAVAGNLDGPGKPFRFADDAIHTPTQAATHCDALAHIFLEDKMWNGYDARLVDSKGARKCGIEHFKDRMVGRGVLLDVARHKRLARLENGYAITSAELDATAAAQGVEVRRGDFVIVRTGQMADHLARGAWESYAGGDAPGLAFETCLWLHEKEIAMISADTWGIEVRPNESDEVNQPWHWVTIPAIGITHGEMFFVEGLADDCAADGVWEFLFCAAPLNITGGCGSPLTPLAIK
jgi:kynurenine formamidase